MSDIKLNNYFSVLNTEEEEYNTTTEALGDVEEKTTDDDPNVGSITRYTTLPNGETLIEPNYIVESENTDQNPSRNYDHLQYPRDYKRPWDYDSDDDYNPRALTNYDTDEDERNFLDSDDSDDESSIMVRGYRLFSDILRQSLIKQCKALKAKNTKLGDVSDDSDVDEEELEKNPLGGYFVEDDETSEEAKERFELHREQGKLRAAILSTSKPSHFVEVLSTVPELKKILDYSNSPVMDFLYKMITKECITAEECNTASFATSMMIEACTSKNGIMIIRFLLDRNLLLLQPIESLVDIALGYGRIKIAKLLISRATEAKYDGRCELANAAMYGKTKVVKFLLDHGTDVHYSEDTPLILATIMGHLECVKLLLEHGANVHAFYDSPIKKAVRHGHVQIAKCLIEHGADYKKYNSSLLWNAILGGHSVMYGLLVSAGLNPDLLEPQLAAIHDIETMLNPKLIRIGTEMMAGKERSK